MTQSACFRMPPRCQSAPTAGYPDASLSAAGLCGGGRRPSGGHASAVHRDCADSAGPPAGSSAVAPPGCNAASSSAAHDRTRSTRRPPAGSYHTRNGGSRVAGPALRAWTPNAKPAKINSSGAPAPGSEAGDGGSCQTWPSPASFPAPILSLTCPRPTRRRACARDDDADP